MYRVTKPSLFRKFIDNLNKLLLQCIVMATFLGILPITILILYSVAKQEYINALINCGILLTLIKANKLVQG